MDKEIQTLNLNVLHVDDDVFELEKISNSLKESSYGINFHVESFGGSEQYLKRLPKKPFPHIVILDVELNEEKENGISLAEKTRKTMPNSVILMSSSFDDGKTITNCLKAGADDFFSKRADKGELGLRISNSYNLAMLKRGIGSNAVSGVEVSSRKLPAIAGHTMEKIAKRIPSILESAIRAVHIEGESGTGKEVVADLFAAHLPQNQPFIKVNCGAITPTLVESELFGHIKGSFTGAVSDKRGLIEAATGGWIFLDEIASLSLTAQVALLRAIENQEIIRVGDNTSRKINVRFLSATNIPIVKLIEQEKFRQDLWQRLCETKVMLNPLRKRPEEIEPLIVHFCKTMEGGPYEISKPAIEVLCAFSWSNGNIRELRNCLRSMTEFHVNKSLTPLSIPEHVWHEIGDKKGHYDEVPSSVNEPEEQGQQKELIIKWKSDEIPDYDLLSDILLLELVRKLSSGKRLASLRSLSKEIGMARSTLSTRLKGLVERNLITFEELNNLVGYGEKIGN